MLAPFSAGLVIYWAWSNTLSIAQQYMIMRRHGTPIGNKGKAVAVAIPAAKPAAAAAVAKRERKGRGPEKKD
jgi:YidC/Oxa1 family membrane protein insertase